MACKSALQSPVSFLLLSMKNLKHLSPGLTVKNQKNQLQKEDQLWKVTTQLKFFFHEKQIQKQIV
jgi:hypothetical protein